MSESLDGWIERLLRCELLTELEVTQLCQIVCFFPPIYTPTGVFHGSIFKFVTF
jgi:hypothetical protein